jgi:hypothetical protein
VGNALALWRKTSAPEFWMKWRESHPDAEQLDTAADDLTEHDHQDDEGA